mgnify:CR=1 FL=1
MGTPLAAADVRQRLVAARIPARVRWPKRHAAAAVRPSARTRPPPRAYLTFNPQGVGIISASLISFGTPEQQRRWAVPILRAEMTASLGMSEPGAGSDLASLRTRAVPRRRRLRRQRAEGVDVRRPRRRRSADFRSHRSKRTQAQGHQRADDPDRPSRCGPATVRVGVRSRRPGLQRGLLQRRAGACREPRRRRSTRAGGWPTAHWVTNETCCG